MMVLKAHKTYKDLLDKREEDFNNLCSIANISNEDAKSIKDLYKYLLEVAGFSPIEALIQSLDVYVGTEDSISKLTEYKR